MKSSYALALIFAALTAGNLRGANEEQAVKPQLAREKAIAALRATLDMPDTRPPEKLDRLRTAIHDVTQLAKANVVVVDELTAAAAKTEKASEKDRAASLLEGAVRSSLEFLEFKPVMEAKLPKGFPKPTPVGEIAVKTYPTYRAATTAMEGNSDGAFWTLFGHITVNNIAMTAPVEITYSTESAVAGSQIRRRSMAFLYGNSSIGKIGTEKAVSVIDVTPRRSLSIGMRGDLTDESVLNGRQYLLKWIATHSGEYKAAGELRVLGYNSPMIPVKNRYFEVEIPVEPGRENLENSR